MKTKNLLSILFFSIISSIDAQLYNAEAWRHASAYLKESMNDKVKPCTDFYEHVCGNYIANNVTYASDIVADILTKAIENIDLEDTNITKYERKVRLFYNQCTSKKLDQLWPKQLYDAIAKRMGDLPLFAKLKTKNKTENSSIKFNPWRLIGQLQRQLVQTLGVKATIGFVDVDCETKKAQLQLELQSFEEDENFKTETIRSTVFYLAEWLDYNKTDVESAIEPWLKKVMAFYDDWKNLTIEGDYGEISLSNMSREIPNFDWIAYFQGLLPDNVGQVLLSNMSNEIFVYDVQLMDALGKMFKRHSEDTIKSLAFLKVYYNQQMVVDTPSQWCLQYAVSLLQKFLRLLNIAKQLLNNC